MRVAILRVIFILTLFKMIFKNKIKEIEKEIEERKKGCGHFGCPYTKENDNQIYEQDCICDNCIEIIKDLKSNLKLLKDLQKQVQEKIEDIKEKYEKWDTDNIHGSFKYNIKALEELKKSLEEMK